MFCMDKHNQESDCYKGLSWVRCAKCGQKIPENDLSDCKQDDGTYICTGCQHDEDSEKLREEMRRV